MHETFISELDDGCWYFFDPNFRDEGFGPLGFDEAEMIKHIRDITLISGRHSYTACPYPMRAMCRYANRQDLRRNAIQTCPDLRLIIEPGGFERG